MNSYNDAFFSNSDLLHIPASPAFKSSYDLELPIPELGPSALFPLGDDKSQTITAFDTPYSPMQFLRSTPVPDYEKQEQLSLDFDFPFFYNVGADPNFLDVDEHSTNTSGNSSTSSGDYSDCDVDIETVEEPTPNNQYHPLPSACLGEEINSVSQMDSTTTDPVLNNSKPIEVLLKPARKNSHKYLSFFPSKIYCAPYKYDILIRMKSTSYQGRGLDIILNSAETQTKLKCKSQDQVPIVVEKTKATPSSNGVVEIMCRVRFNVCSFHYGKKPFTLRLLFSGANKQPVEYTSEPFSTYARKNDKDDIWDRQGSAPMYSEVATKSLRSRSRNSPRSQKRKNSFNEERPKKRQRNSLS